MFTLSRIFFVCFCTWCVTVPVYAADTDVFVLSAAEWNVPRSTGTIVSMPAINQAVKTYEQAGSATIQVRYPGGDEGTLWANELRSWLVALGIASHDIELLPGAREVGQLELRVVPQIRRDKPLD